MFRGFEELSPKVMLQMRSRMSGVAEWAAPRRSFVNRIEEVSLMDAKTRDLGRRPFYRAHARFSPGASKRIEDMMSEIAASVLIVTTLNSENLTFVISNV